MRGSLTFLTFLLVIFFINLEAAKAQQGTLEGTVTEEQTGEPIPFINVVLEREGAQVAGTETNMDGEYRMGNLEPGSYTIRATSVNHQNVEITDVRVQANQITRENFTMTDDAVDLDEFEVTERQQPLIEVDDATSGETMDRQDIADLPTRDVNQMARLTGGVQSVDGGTPNIRGQRSDGTVYYVDGVRVRGARGVPQSAIEQHSTQIGGIPARFGDATGGIISITTRSAASEFEGSVDLRSSQFLDPYDYNNLDAHITGPLWTRENEEGEEEAVIGYFLAGELSYRGDISPQGFGIHTVDDNTKEELDEDPIMRNPNGDGFVPRAQEVTAEDIEEVRKRPNSDGIQYQINPRLDINLAENTNLRIGGQVSQYSRDIFQYDYSMFAPQAHPRAINNTYRGYARLNQSFDIDQDDDARFNVDDAYYNINVSWTGNYDETLNPDHEDNYFRYGHIGQFEVPREPSYELDTRTIDGEEVEAMYQTGFSGTGIDFTPSEYNEIPSNYTKSFFEKRRRNVGTRDEIRASGIPINGGTPPLVYSIWRSPGHYFGTHFQNEQQTYSANADASITIEGHELSFGVEYEQQVERNFNVAGSRMWTEMRQLANEQFEGFEEEPKEIIEGGEEELDIIKFQRNINEGNQTTFDERFRNKLIEEGRTDVHGDPIDQYTEINTDRYGPDMYSIDMFSPSEVWRGGSSPLVNYQGYDHHGERLSGADADVPFFDDEGNVEFLESGRISAHNPSYQAAFIQDKFSFRDLIFQIGVRFDRYDANQQVLSDPYSLYPIREAGEDDFADQFEDYQKPDNIGDDYKVYANDTEDPTQVVGFRKDGRWFDREGEEIDDPETLAEGAGGSLTPWLLDGREELRPESFEDYEPSFDVLPRIAFSFPISERSSFQANYDHLTQRPSDNNNASINDFYFLEETATQSNPNAALGPERRVNYELGFQQKIGNNSALKFEGYYGEIRDMIQITQFNGAYPTSYQSFDNLDFGTVKGLTTEYTYRPIDGNLRLRGNYTLQFADGTGSSQETQEGLIAVGQPNLRTPMPLDFDIRHDITASIGYNFAGGEAYDGPETEGGFKILENTGFNFIFEAKSGTPYSRQSNVTQAVAIGVQDRTNLEGEINAARLPWNFTADMEISRNFDVNEHSFGVNLWIQNLFDTRNISDVYRYTGLPDDDGFLSHPEGRQAANDATDPQAYRDQYTRKANDPSNFFTPRRIRLGASYNF